MSYGAEAEVLEPEALREEIREELKKLKEIYKFPMV
jgi:predicted DNA-binding transcriptional regulator YafY